MSFKIKQYDDKTALKATLQSEGKPVDLTKVSEIRFLMKERYGETLLIDKPAFIVDEAGGKVWLPFEASETSKAGNFRGEFVLNFKDSRKETFPNEGYIPISIEESNIALKMTVGG